MADFRIWGRIEHIGPNEFFVIGSAVPESGGEGATVLTSTAPSLDQANTEKARLMMEVGKTVQARGDRVVDVE
jgi:hypothetical protein